MRISWGHLFLAWWAVVATTAVSTAPRTRRTPRPTAPAGRLQQAGICAVSEPDGARGYVCDITARRVTSSAEYG